MKQKQNKYIAWKANSNCEPIEGTDRVFIGKSKRDIIKHIAHEEGVEHQHNDSIVRCKNGNIWFVALPNDFNS